MWPLLNSNITGAFAIGIRGIMWKKLNAKYLLKISLGFSNIVIKV